MAADRTRGADRIGIINVHDSEDRIRMPTRSIVQRAIAKTQRYWKHIACSYVADRTKHVARKDMQSTQHARLMQSQVQFVPSFAARKRSISAARGTARAARSMCRQARGTQHAARSTYTWHAAAARST
jgi:uncharacterized protein YhbP (UPF0306 family)